MRIPNLFRRRRAEQELELELRAYLEALAAEKVRAGLAPKAAWREARLELGGMDQVKEQVRDVRGGVGLERFAADLRYSWRLLRRSPGFAAVTIVTLALGIGANTALFSVVEALLLRPLPYRDADRLVYISEVTPGAPVARVPSPDFALWRDHGRLFERIEGFGGGGDHNLTGLGEPERISGVTVTAGFLDLIGVRPALGRNFTREEDSSDGPGAVILSHALWRRRFGASAATIGRSLQLDGRPYAVVGVLPAGFVFPDNLYKADLLIPMGLPPAPVWTGGRYRLLKVMARLRPGVGVAALRAELHGLATSPSAGVPAEEAEFRRGMQVTAAPLREWLAGDVRRLLLVLQAAVAIVLLIGCLNLANLQIARAVARRKEMALRAALGAGRGRIARQLLTESLLPGVLGAGGGLVLGYGGLRVLRHYLPADLHLLATARIDGVVLAFTAAVALLAVVLTGLGPVLVGSIGSLGAWLKEGGRTTAAESHHRLRGAIVVAEVALAMVLVSGAGLLTRGFLRLAAVDPGFDPHGVLALEITLPGGFGPVGPSAGPARRDPLEFFTHVLERVSAIPGVESAAVGMGLPLSGGHPFIDIEVEGGRVPDGKRVDVPFVPVSSGYFHTLRIPLLRGRPFGAGDDPHSPPVAIVNQAFADQFFGGKALGKRFRTEQWTEIVGIAGNVRQTGLRGVESPLVYMPLPQFSVPSVFLVMRSALSLAPLSHQAAQAVRAVDPDQPVYDVASMEERMGQSLRNDRANVLLMSTFGGLALLLAAVGIFGVMAYSVNRRLHEIGVRMALGASRADVLRAVFGQGMTLTACGIVLGLAGALLLTRPMAALLYRIPANDPTTLASVAALFAAVAALACLVPARWAARVDPARMLRHD